MSKQTDESDPPLNKPMRGDVKKYKVFVKDPETKNIKKVNFGDKNMEIRRDNPERRKSFRARHKCDTAKDKTTPRYWSCKFWDKTPVSKMIEDEMKEIKVQTESGPHFFFAKGIASPFKELITESDKKVTRSGLKKILSRVQDDGKISGFSKHEINDETMYSSKDKKSVMSIEEALVDFALDEAIPYWHVAAYLDSADVIKDLDTLSGTILDLEKSGSDEFFLKKDVDVYEEASEIFKEALPKFVKSLNTKQKSYLKDLWEESVQNLEEMSDQDVNQMSVIKIVDYILKKKIKRSDVERVLEKLRSYAKLDAINKTLNKLEIDGAVFEAEKKSYQKLLKNLKKQGADDPKGLAAWIGRKKLGKAEFQRRAAKGRSEDKEVSEIKKKT